MATVELLNTIDYLLADKCKEIHLKLSKTVGRLTLPATTQSFPFYSTLDKADLMLQWLILHNVS